MLYIALAAMNLVSLDAISPLSTVALYASKHHVAKIQIEKKPTRMINCKSKGDI